MSDARATPAASPAVDGGQVEGEEEELLPRCACGTDRESKFCVRDREYSFLRTLYLLWGGTSVPTKVSFRCVKCGKTFDVTTHPSECRQYIT
jgi:hypothetical protein